MVSSSLSVRLHLLRVSLFGLVAVLALGPLAAGAGVVGQPRVEVA